MSDENKFFRFLWRFNAIAIALAMIGFLFVSGAALVFSLMRSMPFEKPQGHFTPVPTTAEAKNTYRLKPSGSVAFLKDGGGQDAYLVYSLGDWDGAPNAYGLQHIVAGSSNRIREPYNTNLLFVSAETGQSRWLFKGYGRNIINWDAVTDPTANADNPVAEGDKPAVVSAYTLQGSFSTVKALVLKVIEKDTNHDGVLTATDGVTLYAWHVADAAPVKLLNADLILSQQQVGKDRYVVSYETGDQAWIAVFSTPDFKLLANKTLPKLPS